MRLLTQGSLPPEMGGPVRGGVATFHACLLEGLGEIDEIELVGVLPPGPLTHDSGLPIFVRPAEMSRAEHYEELLQTVRPDVVLMNHVAHTIGVTHARIDSPPPALGIAHSWHSLTFTEADDAERRRGVTEEALDGLAAMVVPSNYCLGEGQRLGLSYPPIAESIHYPLQSLYLDQTIDVDASTRTGVLFLGSLTSRKNPRALVEAAASMDDLQVLIVGQGELEAVLENSITQRGLANRVRIARDIPADRHLEAIRDLLLGARVMCLPSSSESFGLVFIEALACGTPVVGFGPTVREIGETMGLEIGVPLDDPEPAAIAAAIERVLAVEWDREELRRATLRHFAPQRAIARYTDLLRRIVEETRTPLPDA